MDNKEDKAEEVNVIIHVTVDDNNKAETTKVQDGTPKRGKRWKKWRARIGACALATSIISGTLLIFLSCSLESPNEAGIKVMAFLMGACIFSIIIFVLAAFSELGEAEFPGWAWWT